MKRDNRGGLGQTAMIISLFISIALYIGSMDTSQSNPIKYNGGDVLSNFFNPQNQEVNSNVLGGLPQNPSTTGVNTASSTNAFGLVDGLFLIMSGSYSFIKLLVGIVLAPINLMNVDGMPTALKLLIAVPLQLLNVLGIVSLVRGVFSW